MDFAFHPTHPCRQTVSFCNSRQVMTCVALKNTDSTCPHSIGSVGNFGLITLLTRKRLCLATGVTAVHLLRSSFLGLTGFMSLDPGSAQTCGFDFLPQLDHRQCVITATVKAGIIEPDSRTNHQQSPSCPPRRGKWGQVAMTFVNDPGKINNHAIAEEAKWQHQTI